MFRRLHDAIIKVTNENKINKCEIKIELQLSLIYIAEVATQIL